MRGIRATVSNSHANTSQAIELLSVSDVTSQALHTNFNITLTQSELPKLTATSKYSSLLTVSSPCPLPIALCASGEVHVKNGGL